MTLEPASRRLGLVWWCGGVHGKEAEEAGRATRKGAHLQTAAQTHPAHGTRSRPGARDKGHRGGLDAKRHEGAPATRTTGDGAHRGGSAAGLMADERKIPIRAH